MVRWRQFNYEENQRKSNQLIRFWVWYFYHFDELERIRIIYTKWIDSPCLMLFLVLAATRVQMEKYSGNKLRVCVWPKLCDDIPDDCRDQEVCIVLWLFSYFQFIFSYRFIIALMLLLKRPFRTQRPPTTTKNCIFLTFFC